MVAFFSEFCLALGLGQLAAAHLHWRAISLVGARRGWGYVTGLALCLIGGRLLPSSLGALWVAPPAILLALIVLAGVASVIPPEPTPEVMIQPDPLHPKPDQFISIPDGEYYGPGLLLQPANPGGMAVCLIHGSGCHKSFFHWRIAETLLQQGLTVLTIDLPGHGDYRHRPLAYPDALTCIPAAIAFLKNQPGLKKIGLVGISLGGAFAARAVASGLAVDALAVVQTPIEVNYNQTLVWRETWAALHAPITDLLQEVTFLKLRKMWLTGGYVGQQNVIEMLRCLNPLEAAAHLSNTPTLFLYGDRDWIAPPDHAGDLYQAAPHAELRVLPGLSHVTLILHRLACAYLANWLREALVAEIVND